MTRSPSAALTRRAILAGLAATGAVAPLSRPRAAAPTVHEVAIEGFKFVPSSLSVRPGDRVRWVNRDIVPHTATAKDGRFDSGKLTKDAAWELTVTESGTIPYFCVFHPNMTGEIEVE